MDAANPDAWIDREMAPLRLKLWELADLYRREAAPLVHAMVELEKRRTCIEVMVEVEGHPRIVLVQRPG